MTPQGLEVWLPAQPPKQCLPLRPPEIGWCLVHLESLVVAGEALASSSVFHCSRFKQL